MIKSGPSGRDEGSDILEKYRNLIAEGRYDEAERLEGRIGTDIRLTYVISEVIMRGGEAAADLIRRFAYRGYGDEWARKYAPELLEKEQIRKI